MSVVIEQPRVAVLHDHVMPDSPPDEQDNLRQAEEIGAALEHLGFAVSKIPVSRNVHECLASLRDTRPDAVFNLVESIEGDGRLCYVASALLEAQGLRFTGAGTRGLLCSGDKLIAKAVLDSVGVATPMHASSEAALEHWGDDVVGIVKPACEDASVGIDAHSVVRGGSRLAAELCRRRRRFGGAWFVERFIEGRELNVAVLADSERLEVMPIAEIEFLDYPSDRPRIVDYDAKWRTESHAYTHTPRRFVDPRRERALCEELERIAIDCHRALDLGSYARIDFRVDADGRPYVLEANANPCLSSDAGFVAAAARAGLNIEQIVERIMNACGLSSPRTTIAGKNASRAAFAAHALGSDRRTSAVH